MKTTSTDQQVPDLRQGQTNAAGLNVLKRDQPSH